MDNINLASADAQHNRALADCREYLIASFGIDPLEEFTALPLRAIEAAASDFAAIDREHPEARRALERVLDRLATFQDWYHDECVRQGVAL